MSVTIEDLVKIRKTHADGWQAYNRMRTVTQGSPQGTLQRLLWEGFREGKINLGTLDDCWHGLGSSPDMYDGKDFIALLQEIAKRHAKTSSTSHNSLWFDSHTPGWPLNFDNVLNAKQDDPTFRAQTASLWHTLPAPFCDALGYRLALHKIIPVEDLPEHLLEEYAAFSLRTQEDESDRLWSPAAWPEQVWHEARLKAAVHDPTLIIKSWHPLAQFASIATPEQLAQATAKLGSSTDRTLPPLTFLASHGAIYLESLRAALEALDLNPASLGGYKQATPLFWLGFGYLAACQGAGDVPDKSTHDALAYLLAHYEPYWGGSSFVEYHQLLASYLTVVPTPDLERMLLAPTTPIKLFVTACPTPPVLDALVAHIVGLSKTEYVSGYDLARQLLIVLTKIGEPLIEPVCAALTAKKAPAAREVFIDFLCTLPHAPQIPPTFAHCLTDSAKGIQEKAHHGLLRAQPEDVVAALEPLLSERSKKSRLAAAKLLIELTPTPAGWALAQTQLTAEKVDEIRALLEQVQDPGEVTPEDSALDARLWEVASELHENQGASWRSHEALGDDLLTAFMYAWSLDADTGSISFDFSTHRDSLTRSWQALLTSRQQPDDCAVAVRLFAVLRHYYYSNYSEQLDALYGQDVVGAALAHFLVSEASYRPTYFKPFSSQDKSQLAMQQWVLSHYADQAAPIIPGMLGEKNKTPRTDALEFLRKHPDVIDAATLLEGLSNASKTARVAIVQAVEIVGECDCIALLEPLLKDRNAAVVAAVKKTIAHIAARAFDPEQYSDDAALDAALGGLPRVELPAQMRAQRDALTVPIWSTSGEPMSAGAMDWLLAEAFGESMRRESQPLKVVCRKLQSAGVHQLCEDLIIKVSNEHIAGWTLFMQSTLASEARIQKTGARLEEFASSQSYGWGDHGVEVMVRRNSPLTIRTLEDWARKSRRDALKSRASSGLARMARARGISRDELVELGISDFGFDAHGKRWFDYGARTIRVELGVGDELIYVDESADNTLKTMPKSAASDDDELVTQARADVSLLKKELKRMRRTQKTRFERAMVSGQRWELPTWRKRYALNPVMRSFTRGMLWGLFHAESDALLDVVHVDESGDFINVTNDVVTCDDAAHRVGVVHPARLTPEARQQWLAVFAEDELIESFPQLTRTIHNRSPWLDEANTRALCARFKGVHPMTFMGRAERLGWEKGARADAGLISSTSCQMGPWAISLTHDSYSPEYTSEGDLLYVQDIDVNKKGAQRVAPGELPDDIFSELIDHLIRMTGGVEDASA